jgi:hypothetical protein
MKCLIKEKKLQRQERGYFKFKNLIVKQEGAGTLIRTVGTWQEKEHESAKIMSLPAYEQNMNLP